MWYPFDLSCKLQMLLSYLSFTVGTFDFKQREVNKLRKLLQLIPCSIRVEMSNCIVILLLVALLQLASGFSALRSPIRNVRFSLNMVQKEAFQLVLLRHGESSWNKENKFTGWYDCPLSEKGHAEAAAAGALLKDEGK